MKCLILPFFLLGFTYADVTRFSYYNQVDKYYLLHNEQLEWIDAVLACSADNASLAMPKTVADHDVIKSITQESLWLGFHDMFDDGSWVSLSGESLEYYFKEWYNDKPKMNNNRHCGAYLKDTKGMHDEHCDSKKSFVCERQGAFVDPEQQYCGTSCLLPDLKYTCNTSLARCYKVHTNPKIWANAQDICVAEGGHLAIVKDKDEEDFMIALMRRPENRAFHVQYYEHALIGYHDIFREDLLMSVKGENIRNFGYFNQHLANGGTGENCGSLWIYGGLDDYPCNTKGLFICEKNIDYLDIK